jgi:hypothetical protein
MINQINGRLAEIKQAKDANDTKKYNDLISLISNSFAFNYSFGSVVKPPQCDGNILTFIKEVIDKNPTWFKQSHRIIYTDTLNNENVVAIINEVQKKINEKGLFRGVGGNHSKKRTTSAKRKSIKRSRSNRRRHRRTARK